MSKFKSLSPEELNAAVGEMLERQAIIDLQSDYWWLIDSKQWDKWADVLTDDMAFYHNGVLVHQEGAAKHVEMTRGSLDYMISVHQGHQYKIKFTSATTAEGRWVLNDILTVVQNGGKIEGQGYYFFDYIKCDDGKWRIKTIRLGYFRFQQPDKDPDFTAEIPYKTALS